MTVDQLRPFLREHWTQMKEQLLDGVDRMFESRGHRFCRYADDCTIYVHSQRTGEWVLESVTRFVEQK